MKMLTARRIALSLVSAPTCKARTGRVFWARAKRSNPNAPSEAPIARPTNNQTRVATSLRPALRQIVTRLHVASRYLNVQHRRFVEGRGCDLAFHERCHRRSICVRSTSIVLKNSEIERSRKSHICTQSIIYAGGRRAKPLGRVPHGKGGQSAEPLSNFPSRLPAVL